MPLVPNVGIGNADVAKLRFGGGEGKKEAKGEQAELL